MLHFAWFLILSFQKIIYLYVPRRLTETVINFAEQLKSDDRAFIFVVPPLRPG